MQESPTMRKKGWCGWTTEPGGTWQELRLERWTESEEAESYGAILDCVKNL